MQPWPIGHGKRTHGPSAQSRWAPATPPGSLRSGSPESVCASPSSRRATPFRPIFAPDEPLYRELAQALRSGRVDERLQFVSPLYPWLLAWAGSARALVMAQLALGSATAPALYLAARRSRGDRWMAATAGGLVLLHGPLLAFETAILPIAPALAGLALALAVAAPLERPAAPESTPAPHPPRLAFAAGLALAAAVLCAPALLPIPLLWAAALGVRRGPHAGALALALLAPLVLALGATAARNMAVGLPASPARSELRDHPRPRQPARSRRLLPPPAGLRWLQGQPARPGARRRRGRGRKSPELARGRRLLAQGRAREPGRRTRARRRPVASKARSLPEPALRGRRARARAPAVREHWVPLRWLPVSFPLLAVAGTFGLWRTRRSAVGSLAVASGALATCLLFYVSDRYRLPAALGLALPAAGGAIALARGGAAPRFALGSAVAVAFVQLLASEPSDDQRRRALVREAEAAEHRGAYERALDGYGALSRTGTDARLLARDRTHAAGPATQRRGGALARRCGRGPARRRAARERLRRRAAPIGPRRRGTRCIRARRGPRSAPPGSHVEPCGAARAHRGLRARGRPLRRLRPPAARARRGLARSRPLAPGRGRDRGAAARDRRRASPRREPR